MAFALSFGNHGFRESRLRKKLLKHFGVPAGQIATVGRQFPITARVDIQAAIEQLLQNRPGTKLLGILSPNQHEPPSLAQTLGGSAHFPTDIGPLQHDEIDIGETVPVRCLRNGIWLSRDKGLPFAIIMAPGGRFGLRSGVQVEIAVPAGEPGHNSPRRSIVTLNYSSLPLPDDDARAKLAKLYAPGLEISQEVMNILVSRSKGVSAAFIRELIRRCAQFEVELSGGRTISQAAVDAALEEMLFTGGMLNRRLLGGEGADASSRGSISGSPSVSLSIATRS